MRPIDADALLQKRAQAKKFGGEMYVIGQGYVMDAPTIAIEDIIPSLTPEQAAAFAQPNRPLTKGELQRMDGQPAWCEEDQVWGIVSVESSGPWALIPFFCEHRDGVPFTLDIEKRHLTIYRHPPMENKPLTLEELRTMDAQPVWMQAFCSGWVLVWCKSGGNVFVTDASGGTEAITDIRGAKFYRYPVTETSKEKTV